MRPPSPPQLQFLNNTSSSSSSANALRTLRCTTSSAAAAAAAAAAVRCCARSQSPYHCNLLVAGFDEGGVGPSLYWLDYLATLHKVNTGGTGYGEHAPCWAPPQRLDKGRRLRRRRRWARQMLLQQQQQQQERLWLRQQQQPCKLRVACAVSRCACS